MAPSQSSSDLQFQEWGRSGFNQDAASSMSSGAEHLVVVVPGHTFVPLLSVGQLHDALQLVLPEAVIWVADMGKVVVCGDSLLKEDDIDFAGLQLAQVVSAKLDALEHGSDRVFSLSFWCLGTGGLSVRASLAWLTAYHSRLMTYVSLGTPHLGLFLPGLSWCYWCRVGLWRLCNSRTLWLEQLMHMEGRRARGSRLHHLCGSGNELERFSNVIFIGSRNDFLVPLSSSILCVDGCSSKAAAANACLDIPDAMPRSKILWMFLPILWLARLRAWTSLTCMLVTMAAALLLPSPPGLLGRRLEAVKIQLWDFFNTVRGEVEPELDRHFAHLLLSAVSANKLLQVEVWTKEACWSFNRGFASDVLAKRQWIKTLVERYGPFLTQARKKGQDPTLSCKPVATPLRQQAGKLQPMSRMWSTSKLVAAGCSSVVSSIRSRHSGWTCPGSSETWNGSRVLL